MESLKHFGCSLVTQPEPLRLVEPGHRMFHHHPENPKARTMRVVLLTRQHRLDLARPRLVDVRLPAVAPVAKVFPGTPAGATPHPRHRRNGVQQRNRHPTVRDVRRRGPYRQRHAVSVDDHMALASVLAPVRRVGAGVRPPKTARNEALSAMARENSSRPCLPNLRSRTSWRRGQTPAWVHSCIRRQQVEPLGAISAGMSPQALPVRSTKRMPTKHSRSSAGGRPPFGRGARTGNKGRTSAQSSSLTHSRAMLISRKEGHQGALSSTFNGLQGF